MKRLHVPRVLAVVLIGGGAAIGGVASCDRDGSPRDAIADGIARDGVTSDARTCNIYCGSVGSDHSACPHPTCWVHEMCPAGCEVCQIECVPIGSDDTNCPKTTCADPNGQCLPGCMLDPMG